MSESIDVYYGAHPKWINSDITINYPLTKVKRAIAKFGYDIIISDQYEWYYFGSTDYPEDYDELFMYLEVNQEGYRVIDTSNNNLVLERKFWNTL